MFGFGQLIDILKKNPKKIVFTEGSDPRILEAASRLLASNFLSPILVGKEDEIQRAAEESGFNIRGAHIVDPDTYECECWDVVLTPAVKAARLQYVTEGLDNSESSQVKSNCRVLSFSKEESPVIVIDSIIGLTLTVKLSLTSALHP